MICLDTGDLLQRICASGTIAVLIKIAAVAGSTPRNCDARMIVTADETAGTIGGGHLEWHAISLARQMIAENIRIRQVDLPLGPMMGQCCGGRVRLAFQTLYHEDALEMAEAERASQLQSVYVFGMGHTGRVLAQIMALLPFNTTLVDDRADYLEGLPASCRSIYSQDPVTLVKTAPAAAAFVILTHSHALDFRLAEAALLRRDAAYVGMIGSQTKRRQFEAMFRKQGNTPHLLHRLVCPLGGGDIKDKRPQIIATLTTAELVRHLAICEGDDYRISDAEHVGAFTA